MTDIILAESTTMLMFTLLKFLILIIDQKVKLFGDINQIYAMME